MKIPLYSALIACLGLLASSPARASQFNVLKAFPAPGLDGARPTDLAILGGRIYGITSLGGKEGKGVFYQINPDGTGFKKIREFSANEEGSPISLVAAGDRLVVALENETLGGNLYTYLPGNESWNKLEVASLNHSSFSAGNLSFVSSGYVYGTDRGSEFGISPPGVTYYGGDVIRLNLFGGSYTESLQDFKGQVNAMQVIESGNMLYGVTIGGGLLDSGMIFRVNKDGSNYEVVKSMPADFFALSSQSIVLLDGKLYGISTGGGMAEPSSSGFLYSMNLDGTGYKVIKSFAAHNAQLGNPRSLATDGTTLYTVANYGYKKGKWGALIAIRPDGTAQQKLAEFASAANGSTGKELVNLLCSGGRLYGANFEGGTGGLGTIWSYDLGLGISLKILPPKRTLKPNQSARFTVLLTNGSLAPATVDLNFSSSNPFRVLAPVTQTGIFVPARKSPRAAAGTKRINFNMTAASEKGPAIISVLAGEDAFASCDITVR